MTTFDVTTDTLARQKPVRVLIALRISYLTDESTSLERQLKDAREYISKKAALGLNWVEVGVARDVHVSATKQHPLDRTELGNWLKERAPEFDLILFWKLDRFIRKVTDMQDMLRWADAHGRKTFASVTEPIFDMTGPLQRAIITLFSALAELEAKNTSVRVKSFRESIREQQRWPGGMPTYGFEVYTGEDGAARLRQNPHQVNVIREIANRLVTTRDTPAIVADDLNARKEPTPRGARPSSRIVESGRAYQWTAAGLRKLLKNEALMGWKMESRQVPGKKYFESTPIIDSTGNKIRMAEPIFTDKEWKTLQDHLNERSFSVSSPKHVTPFLDVILCGYCKGKMRLHVSRRETKTGRKEYPKFRCVSPRKVGDRTRYGCDQQESWDPGRLLAAFEEHLLKQLGDAEAEERIYVVGDENETRMREIEELVPVIMADMGPGRRYATALLRPQAEKLLDNLSAEYEGLRRMPTGDRWEYRSLGKTWREMWEASKVPELEKLMRRNGVQFLCYPDSFELVTPARLMV
ncbi:recombinase family protein [Streptomyces sp. GESEQ-4]|uniref:recombinase family protein n=1 Tax=Streptomyces sp. GESEQ-4 TaxID=2812655 RepID=UPI001B3293CC|nr:recombinase family protein [Streptomyces sp. GESEQ-4]